ncbi:STAS domain-containing protein [Actinomadura sp. KC345]|uniref:MEDS domain-containing protein n=1 Tax=Actinomadura sp. KC345 TaxID=2530371 RepID=UPI00104B4D39|nr:MEDS domain-containing protein [Actinomadura sp. KC345]TDC58087.1 STAS domain-containing protein [Actinomadura sp. KC345]
MSAASTHHKPVGRMELGDHLALIFDDDGERRSIMAAYARDGVRAGQKVIYISDAVPAREVLGWLLAAGEDAGSGTDDELVDLTDAMNAGHFVVRTAEETFLASGRFDPSASIELMATEIDLALVQGYQGVRIAGEARFSLRRWPGTEQFGDFERMLDEVFMTTDLKAMAICQFDRRWFDDVRLAEVEVGHMGRVRANDYYDDGSLRITPIFSPPGAELAGVIDGSTRPAAESVLASITTRTGLLCLDLGGVTGCDADGLRLLAGAGRPDRGEGRGLLLRGVPPALRDRLHAEGLVDAPGISIEHRTR